jgi:hypothetical protein
MNAFMHRREKEGDKNTLNWQQHKPEGHAQGNQGSEGEYCAPMKGKPEQSRPIASRQKYLAQDRRKV